ncbi:KGGVGR-motif variant AAA ATPase [Pseudomonas sp. H1_D05]
MKSTDGLGKIITFYSYKGGVGRTMSLANVAFLAALNGQRVLVMDWDLEAPGVNYYFRGLLEAAEAKSLKDSAGLLDILWKWSDIVKSVKSEKDFEIELRSLKNGDIFRDCVKSLITPGFFAGDPKLDLIGAGGRMISTPQMVPYEEALASFSWSTFFEKEAGGLVLDSLRSWAKQNYDLILIDSRTGLADVAGICTMQIPDTVALCFILNRQNIDGVAKVSAAIRSKRKDEVTIRAVPMRVARRDTSEESDARARAIAELTRVGGFSPFSSQEDIKALSVIADENVPFYETLAPFTAPDPSLDLLTLNYVRLAKELIGKDISIPEFDTEVVEIVRRRLVPRHATVEYLSKLNMVEPARAVSEVLHLLESAFEADLEGEELEVEYVNALLGAIDAVASVPENSFNASEMRLKGMDLLRTLYESNSSKWKAKLTEELEVYVEAYSFLMDTEEEVAILEELDVLLAESTTIGDKLKRIKFRRAAARVFVDSRDVAAASQTLGEIFSLVNGFAKNTNNLAPDQVSELNDADVDLALLGGDIDVLNDRLGDAAQKYTSGLARIGVFEVNGFSSDRIRIKVELHLRMVEMPSEYVNAYDAAVHAINAVTWGKNLFSVVRKFNQLSSAILKLPERPDIAFHFCRGLLGPNELRNRSNLASFHGRQPTFALDFLKNVNGLAAVLLTRDYDEETYAVFESLADLINQVLRNMVRRSKTVGGRNRELIALLAQEAKSIFSPLAIEIDVGLLDGGAGYKGMTRSHYRLKDGDDL